MAIIGPNGAGKSTLIKALAGEFPECQGGIHWKSNVKVGYFAQDCDKQIKASDKTVLDWLWQVCPLENVSFVLGMLGRVFLGGEDAKKNTSSLSGGELCRLSLAAIMIEKPNTIVLDEPTNHLDIESIEALTKALKEYSGTLIFVSHDRMFVSELATRIIEIEPTGFYDFQGSYNEFVEKNHKDYLDQSQKAISKMASSNGAKEQIGKQIYLEQKQKRAEENQKKRNLELVMKEVSKLEESLKELENEFSNPSIYEIKSREEIASMVAKKEKLEHALSLKMSEWEKLETDF